MGCAAAAAGGEGERHHNALVRPPASHPHKCAGLASAGWSWPCNGLAHASSFLVPGCCKSSCLLLVLLLPVTPHRCGSLLTG